MEFEELGRRAFWFSVTFSMIITIIAMSLVSSGHPVPEPMKAVVLPAKTLYGFSKTVEAGIRQGGAADVWIAVVSYNVAVAMLTFLWNVLISYITIASVFAYITPPELYFLLAAVYPIGLFFQAAVYYYIGKKIVEIGSQIVSRLISFVSAVV